MEMDAALAQLATLGIGGVVAVIVLMWKRADDKRYADELRADRDRIQTALEANTTAVIEVNRTISAMFEALRGQAATGSALHRIEAKLDRIEGDTNETA